MKRILRTIRKELQAIRNDIAFSFAKRKANRLHKKYRCRYYVLPKSSGKGFNVVSSKRISHYNRSRGKKQKLSINQLLFLAYYFTPSSK